MNKTLLKSDFTVFIILFLFVVLLRQFTVSQMLAAGIDSYYVHSGFKICVNILLAAISIYFIRKNNLQELAGLSKVKVKRAYLLLFPLLYLTIINALFLDDISEENLWLNLFVSGIYCLSVGLSEELTLRGFIQSFLINRFGSSKKNIVIVIFASAAFFGILHLVKFDKGLYGEISQLFFATFIGVMFGVVLLITKRIYPLIIIHAAIDFVAKLDSMGNPAAAQISNPTSLTNSIATSLIVLPCLLYAIYYIWKTDLLKIVKNNTSGNPL
ncbi:CPBP family intramembrane glutamic endopeptidase [Ulvibacter antarcticus]|nr:CPBP family intramembrane glutamic endopeptidase [Ulvibacter antarcticus]